MGPGLLRPVSMTTEAGLKKGDDWIKAAATAAGNYGFETVVNSKPETFSAGFPIEPNRALRRLV